MIEKFDRAWTLGNACWKALLLDKEMLLFPIMSTAALLLAIGGSVGPLWASGTLETIMEGFRANPDSAQDPWVMAVAFGFYFVCYFIMIFFNTALVTCAMIRFAGGDPTVMDGLRSSMRNLHKIFAWALFAASIGFLLNMVEQRLKGVGRFIAGLMGAAWAIATYFVVPVLVLEDVGPIGAVRRSVATVRQTWGESLIAHAGLSALQFIGAIGAALIFFGGLFVFDRDPLLAGALWGCAIAWLIITALVLSTLGAILKAALYIYAIEGTVPDQFDSAMIRDAFRND
ncbi:DUF6159 family protein [Breoghania sp. L-A4]|uniref:DUF6159 family protein n=1 Tax=Breoghania sp. L-A4 TaxID=2304600 RepID=UPI001966EC15|nr:DUF6159 family protein [Breoghania sp. L-A4]